MNFTGFWNSKKLHIVSFAYLVICLVALAQCLVGPEKFYAVGGAAYTNYNNYQIFKYSFFHLIHGKDLYQLSLSEHYDLYKYSPTFSLFFGLLAWLPDAVGLLLWNLVNAFFLLAAIRMLPGIDDRKKSWLLLFCLPELLTSVQNSQSNGLMAGLIIMALVLAERSKYFLSALCIVFSVYIKIFGLAAFVFYLFYKGKPGLIAWSLFCMALMALLPLLVVDSHQLAFLYRSWLHLLQDDRNASVGLSVMGLLESWGHVNASKNWVTMAGMLLFCLPLIHIRKYRDLTFRLLMLASVLIWIVIFNHKAESPSYIIALAGIGIWYFSQPASRINLFLLILAFLLVTISISDLVPSSIRDSFIHPYNIKAVMPVVIWCKLQYDLLSLKYEPLRSTPLSFS